MKVKVGDSAILRNSKFSAEVQVVAIEGGHAWCLYPQSLKIGDSSQYVVSQFRIDMSLLSKDIPDPGMETPIVG